ncbi:transposase [Cohnella sp.]|uniref:IS110 family transposase n=1 Tax=Cohnella sp. TaxID=1883426 RepID=UPI003563741F
MGSWCRYFQEGSCRSCGRFSRDRAWQRLCLPQWCRRVDEAIDVDKGTQASTQQDEIVFGIEPTGHYGFPLAAFLQKQGIEVVVVVNPSHVNKTKELEDNFKIPNSPLIR